MQLGKKTNNLFSNNWQKKAIGQLLQNQNKYYYIFKNI